PLVIQATLTATGNERSVATTVTRRLRSTGDQKSLTIIAGVSHLFKTVALKEGDCLFPLQPTQKMLRLFRTVGPLGHRTRVYNRSMEVRGKDCHRLYPFRFLEVASVYQPGVSVTRLHVGNNLPHHG